MSIYTGVNGVQREIKQIYTGVNGINRESKNSWAGVNGVNRKIWEYDSSGDIPPVPFDNPVYYTIEKPSSSQRGYISWGLNHETYYKIDNPNGTFTLWFVFSKPISPRNNKNALGMSIDLVVQGASVNVTLGAIGTSSNVILQRTCMSNNAIQYLSNVIDLREVGPTHWIDRFAIEIQTIKSNVSCTTFLHASSISIDGQSFSLSIPENTPELIPFYLDEI